MSDPPPALVLHLDINKTILLTGDAAAGASLHDVINSLIASSAWGEVVVDDDGGGGPVWRALPPAPSSSLLPPRAGRPPPAHPSSLTYEHFVKEVLHPYVDVGPDAASRAVAAERNRDVRAVRKALLDAFTSPGQPGAAFAGHADALLAHLRLTEDQVAACASQSLRGMNEFRFLLPAYFTLLLSLLRQRGRRFLVLLRTFGHDLDDVVAEHNLFCAGRHPLYPLDGESPELRTALAALAIPCPANTGAFLRHGDGPGDTHLATVVRDRVTTITGYREIHQHILSLLPPKAAPGGEGGEGGGGRGRAAAFRDHYEFWFARKEAGSAGKLLPFEPSDPDHHSIFFDDNIGKPRDRVRSLRPGEVGATAQQAPLPPPRQVRVDDGKDDDDDDDDDTGIVDARVVSTGESLGLAETRNVHLVSVDPLSAALNDSYFVELVGMCEGESVRRRGRREGRKAGRG
jgi:hypothetical protein